MALASIAGDGGDHTRGVIHLADPVVGSVGDKEVPGGVQRDAFGPVQFGGSGRTVIAAVACGSIAGDSGDHAGGLIHLADPVVAPVGDKEVPDGVHRNAFGITQFGGSGRTVIAAVPLCPIAGDGGDHAGGVIHLADPVVAPVGDEEVTDGVHRDTCGVPQVGGGGRTVVAAVAPVHIIAGDRGDDASGVIHLADAIVATVGDEEVPGGVHRDTQGAVQLGGGGRTVIAEVGAVAPPAGDGGDRAGGVIHLADPIVGSVGDEDVPGGVRRDTLGPVQLGGGGRTVIAGVAGGSIAGNGGNDRIRPDHGAAGGEVAVAGVTGREHLDARRQRRDLERGRAGSERRRAQRDVAIEKRYGSSGGRDAAGRHGCRQGLILSIGERGSRNLQGRRSWGCRHRHGDRPAGDLTYHAIARVGDKNVPGGVHRDARRSPQLGGSGRAAVAAVARVAVARVDAPGDDGDHARGVIHFADHVVAGIRDQEIPGGVHRDTVGPVQFGGGGRTVIAAVAFGSIAGDGGDHAGGVIHLTDHVVARVGDEEVPRGVQRDISGPVQFGSSGRTVVAAVAPGPIAGNRGDEPRGSVHLTDPVVVVVGDEEVPGGVHRHAYRTVQLGGGGGSAIAAEAFASVAGHRGDQVCRGVHLADSVVFVVRDEEVPGGVHRDTIRAAQSGGGGRTVIAAVALSAIAGDRGDHAGGAIHLADATEASVGDEYVAGGVHRDTKGQAQSGGGRRAVIAAVD